MVAGIFESANEYTAFAVTVRYAEVSTMVEFFNKAPAACILMASGRIEKPGRRSSIFTAAGSFSNDLPVSGGASILLVSKAVQ